MAQNVNDTRSVTLRPYAEMRIEIDFKDTLQLKVTAGVAEVFGTELAEQIGYKFTGTKLAVFTYSGCQLELSGLTSVEYVADETPMASYLNVHAALEQIRESAQARSGDGPRVLIVGPRDCGKTSLAKILCGYAYKRDWHPLLVDLNIEDVYVQPCLSLPGTVSAMPITHTMEPSAFHSLANTAATATSPAGSMPIIYFYGHTKHESNFEVYKAQVQALAEQVDRKLKQDHHSRYSGLIIDTAGKLDDKGYEALLQALNLFKATHVLVVGDERLYADLSRKLQSQNKPNQITVVRLRRSGGVVARTDEYRAQLNNKKIREYFYGVPGQLELSPHNAFINPLSIHTIRFAEEITAPPSALPLGVTVGQTAINLVNVTESIILIHSILALSSADEVDEQVMRKNVIGSDYNDSKQRLNMLMPFPGRLPKKVFVMGSVKWFELS